MQAEPIPQRYRIDSDTGCWIWQRTINPRTGYGQLTHEQRSWTAHRFYYERAHGPVPRGLQLDHLCRNRACCNPSHLEPVTAQENVRRGCAANLTAGQYHVLRALDGIGRFAYSGEIATAEHPSRLVRRIIMGLGAHGLVEIVQRDRHARVYARLTEAGRARIAVDTAEPLQTEAA